MRFKWKTVAEYLIPERKYNLVGVALFNIYEYTSWSQNEKLQFSDLQQTTHLNQLLFSHLWSEDNNFLNYYET